MEESEAGDARVAGREVLFHLLALPLTQRVADVKNEGFLGGATGSADPLVMDAFQNSEPGTQARRERLAPLALPQMGGHALHVSGVQLFIRKPRQCLEIRT